MNNNVKLSETEGFVLTRMQAGQNNYQIASELGIRLGTLRSYLIRIMRKYNVHRRYELPGVERKLTDFQQKLLDLRKAGKSYAYIAAEMNLAQSTASSQITQLRKRGYATKKTNGR